MPLCQKCHKPVKSSQRYRLSGDGKAEHVDCFESVAPEQEGPKIKLAEGGKY